MQNALQLTKHNVHCFLFWFSYNYFQYKDAFFTANPDFKWYKLPAPAARTISGYTRSSSESDDRRERLSSFSSEGTSSSGVTQPTIEMVLKRSSSFKAEKFNENTDVGTFKLADEAQMGGLSSLMTNVDAKNGIHTNNNDKFHANNMCDGDANECHDVNGMFSLQLFQNIMWINIQFLIFLLRSIRNTRIASCTW